MTNPKLCVFCRRPRGGKAKSREDFWPTWSHGIDNMAAIGRLGSMTSVGVLPDLPRSNPVMSVIRTRMGRSRLHDRSTTVCQSCNNGWMGSIQQEVAERLRPIFETGAGALDPQDQTLLARWAVMTALVIEQHRSDPALLSDHRHRFYLDPRDLRFMSVWVATAPAPEEAALFYRHAYVGDSGPMAWVHFVVGHLFFICGIGTTVSPTTAFDAFGSVQISPARSDAIDLPRPRGIEGFVVSLSGAAIAALIVEPDSIHSRDRFLARTGSILEPLLGFNFADEGPPPIGPSEPTRR